MIRGSCACGGVRFELSEPPTMMGTCHCSRCRKLGVATFVFVRREAFRWAAGAELVETYAPDPPFTLRRQFCRRCGTGLGEPLAEADAFPLSAQCFDDDPQVRNRFHEWVSAKPAWYEICDDARQFAEHPVKTPPAAESRP